MDNRIDLIIIALYLIGIVGLGVWVGLRSRRAPGASADSYFWRVDV